MPKKAIQGGTFAYAPAELFRVHLVKLFTDPEYVTIRNACVETILEIDPDVIRKGSLVDRCYAILTQDTFPVEKRSRLLKTLDRAIAEYRKEDQVTMEELPDTPQDRITFLDHGVPFAFKRDTLVRFTKTENPFTRAPLPAHVLNVAAMSEDGYKSYIEAAVTTDPAERAAALHTLQHVSPAKKSYVRKPRVPVHDSKHV